MIYKHGGQGSNLTQFLHKTVFCVCFILHHNMEGVHFENFDFYFFALVHAMPYCTSFMYALRVLRSHCLPPSAIHEIARMTTVSSVMYASLAWWGFTLAHDRAMVEQLLRRMKRCGFLPPSAPTAEQLATSADAQLFKAIILNPYHVLNRAVNVYPFKRLTDRW